MENLVIHVKTQMPIYLTKKLVNATRDILRKIMLVQVVIKSAEHVKMLMTV